MVGFEYSRADEPNSLTEELADNEEFNLYRHTDSQGIRIEFIHGQGSSGIQAIRARASHRREYDIYSPRMILLELGTRWTA
jgi:hypothetical protein